MVAAVAVASLFLGTTPARWGACLWMRRALGTTLLGRTRRGGIRLCTQERRRGRAGGRPATLFFGGLALSLGSVCGARARFGSKERDHGLRAQCKDVCPERTVRSREEKSSGVIEEGRTKGGGFGRDARRRDGEVATPVALRARDKGALALGLSRSLFYSL